MIKFDIQKEKLIIDPKFLMFNEFTNIWKWDKTQAKTKATKLLRFVFHLCDLSSDNPLKDIEYDKKEDEAKFRVYGKRDYKFSEEELMLLQPAVDCYAKHNVTPEERVVEVFDKKIDQIKQVLEKTEPEFIKNTNANSGEVKFTSNIDIITKALKEIDNILEAKGKVKAKVLRESVGGKVRGNLKRSALSKGMFNINEDALVVK